MTEIYMSSSFFMIVILAILLVRIWNYIEWNRSKRYAVVFVVSVTVYVALDALFVRCFLNTSTVVETFRVVALLFYMVYVIMPYIWHLFMESYMGITCRKSIRILEAIPLVILIGMILVSVSTGIVWGFDENGSYIRGPLFSGFAVLNLFYYFMAYIQTFYAVVFNTHKQVKYILEASVFSALPLIGILVNTYVIPLYGVYPFQPYCLVVGALLVYLYMVEQQKSRDAADHREKLSLALEQEKDASRKAREAGAVKDTFLANMSHDIRTPMNAILGFADIIARQPGDEAVVRDAVAKIQASGGVLMKIINDVLDLSKIESGKLQIDEENVDLMEMTENLELMLEYSIKKKNIHFQVINRLRHSYVLADSTKLQQVLVNILNNAVKFTPNGGSVILELEERAMDETDSEYTIRVIDNGIGMDEDFQKHAFEAFERERTSTESRIEGTGLGLAIVKKLVELMGGRVEIRSKCGEGTTISIVLRLKITQPMKKPENKSKVSNIDLSGYRVLLAEDNELNAEIALDVLKRAGMRADWVQNGRVCIEQLEQMDADYYQMILMDIQMPVLNGYEATKEIRNLADTSKANILILAMTANAFDDDKRRAMESGMDGFITKPIEVEKMLQTIQAVCEKRTVKVRKNNERIV